MTSDPTYVDHEVISSMLYNRLLESQAYAGKVEAQNDLLKLRLSSAIERLGELGENVVGNHIQ